MAFEYLVNQSVLRPTFVLMDKGFDQYRINARPCQSPTATDQCAVRVSTALTRCGFSFDAFKPHGRVHDLKRKCGIPVDHVLGAEELMRYLKIIWGATNDIKINKRKNHRNAYLAAYNAVKGKTGILYFNDIFFRKNGSYGDHIDLFDGEKCYNELLGITPGGGTSSATESFFERADRIIFFQLP